MAVGVPFADLRGALEWLQRFGKLVDVDEGLSPCHEIGAFLALASKRERRAYRFSQVKGHVTPVVANVVHDRSVLAAAMDVTVESLVGCFGERLATPVSPRLVDDAPVLERNEAVDLPALLPALTHYERDAGPFLTSGMVSIGNPMTDQVERSLCRMQLRGRDGLGLNFLTAPFYDLMPAFTELVQAGTPPAVAVTLGLEPIVLLGAALSPAGKVDKLAMAGAVRAHPVDVVRSPFAGLDVPARAEYLLEGVLEVPGEYDGPMGESSGYYQSTPLSPTLRVQRVSCRDNPVYQALLPTGPESDTLLGLVIEAALAPVVRAEFPFVRRVAFSPGSFGASLVVSVDRARPDEVRALLEHLINLNRTKKVVVVADDVDPADLAAVEWSIVTRSQPDRDVVVRSGLPGHPIDPTCLPERVTSRIGIDATGFTHYQCEGPVTFAPAAWARAEAVFASTRKAGG